MSTDQVLLYDLPSKDGNHCWSLNPWKTRLLLNYKGIDYKTEWVEYPNIEPKWKALNIPPNAEGTAYTIPTIYLPSGNKYIMDSVTIAEAIASAYPSPALEIQTPKRAQVQKHLDAAQGALRPIFVPEVPRVLLNNASLEYWYRTRAARVGMPVDQYGAEQGGDKAFEAAKPHMGELAKLLRENGGPFVEGEKVTYADFVILGWLRMLERLGSEVYGKATTADPDAFSKLLEAARKWLKRDNY